MKMNRDYVFPTTEVVEMMASTIICGSGEKSPASSNPNPGGDAPNAVAPRTLIVK